MPRRHAPALLTASVLLLAACEPPPVATAPPASPAMPTAGTPAGAEPAATAADQVQSEPIPGLG